MHEKKTAVKHMGKIKPRSKRWTGSLLVGKGPDITVTSLWLQNGWVTFGMAGPQWVLNNCQYVMSRERGCVGATFYPALLVCMISKHPAKSPNYIQCAHAYLYTFIHPFSESHIPFSGFKEAETSLLTGGKRRGTSWAERDRQSFTPVWPSSGVWVVWFCIYSIYILLLSHVQ